MLAFRPGLVYTSKWDIPAHKTEYIIFNIEDRKGVKYVWYIWRPLNSDTHYETNCAPDFQMQQFFDDGTFSLKQFV